MLRSCWKKRGLYAPSTRRIRINTVQVVHCSTFFRPRKPIIWSTYWLAILPI
jgi:hypothetical protein